MANPEPFDNHLEQFGVTDEDAVDRLHQALSAKILEVQVKLIQNPQEIESHLDEQRRLVAAHHTLTTPEERSAYLRANQQALELYSGTHLSSQTTIGTIHFCGFGLNQASPPNSHLHSAEKSDLRYCVAYNTCTRRLMTIGTASVTPALDTD